MICKEIECDNKVKTKKSMLCEKHYFRLRRTGSLSDKIPEGMESGSVHMTENYGVLKVLKYKNFKSVDVVFIDTGFKTTTHACSIRTGSVKDKLCASVFGVGYLGVGSFSVSEGGVPTKAYTRWKDMLRRCYDDNFTHARHAYSEVEVCGEWLNFQNFASWFYDNNIDGYDLDKDILSGETKLYSPLTCMFTHPSANSIHAHDKLGATYLIRKGCISISFSNINKTAKLLSLDSGNLCRLLNKKVKQHKGWTLYGEV